MSAYMENGLYFKFRITYFLFFLCVLIKCDQSDSEDCPCKGTTSSQDEIDIKGALECAAVLQKEEEMSSHGINNEFGRRHHLESESDETISDNAQRPFQIATDLLLQNCKLENEDVRGLSTVRMSRYSNLTVMKQCQKTMKRKFCNPLDIYRTYDGSCNNLKHTRWGATLNCYQRLLPANYIGEGGFRESVLGGPLPLPRTVSLHVHPELNKPAKNYNMLYANFGQFLVFGISRMQESTLPNGKELECCQSKWKHPQCASIEMKPEDPFYSQFNVTCMNLARTVLCPTCKLGQRNQMSHTTAFIDGSQIYGSSEDEAKKLRNFDGTGTLQFQSTPHGEIPPASEHPENDGCSHPEKEEICIRCGDGRCNQNPTHSGLHTLFLREHNNMARRLKGICPSWDEERLYQEARRIVGAELQVIAYNEYLPLTLGPKLMKNWSLLIDENKSNGYNHSINPTVWVEFVSAAFRFGHSLVDTVVAKYWPSQDNEWWLRYSYFNPFYLYKGLMDSLFENVIHTQAQTRDQYVQHDLSQYAKMKQGQHYGFDIIAIDIIRGRDHGLPTYTEMVEHCSGGKIKIQTWQDLKRFRIMVPECPATLSETYRDPRDIDLRTGLICEKSAEGAVVGPTAACIISQQFHSLKYGDRFYFDHANQAGSFTDEQREALKQVTLSGIICSNTNATKMTAKAMVYQSDENPLKPCSEVIPLDLSEWMGCK